MVVDKVNNILYYSDFSVFTANHPGTLYKLKLDGSAPIAVTTDARINTIINIAIDPVGNIYVESGIDTYGISANVYKIDFATNAITLLAGNVNFGGAGGSLLADSKGAVWLNYVRRINAATAKFEGPYTASYGSFANAVFQGDDIYVDDTNHLSNNNYGFYKFNLLTGKSTQTDFTLQGIFGQDDANMVTRAASSQGYDPSSKYALDNNENFYAIYEWYTPGQLTRSFSIRKTKNGNGGASTLVLKFNTVFKSLVNFEPYENVGVLFQSDATGNLYLKDNKNDIIKITQ